MIRGKPPPPPPDDLYPFARAMLMKLIHDKGLRWTSHRVEEAHHDLYLEGLKVWQETENEGFAKNRIVTRLANLLRDFGKDDKNQPMSTADFGQVLVPSLEEGKFDAENWLEQKVAVGGPPDRQTLGETDDILSVRRTLAKLSPQCRQVCQWVMAGKKNAEIARVMGISLRTVEREREAFRKEYEDAYGKPKRFRPRA